MLQTNLIIQFLCELKTYISVSILYNFKIGKVVKCGTEYKVYFLLSTKLLWFSEKICNFKNLLIMRNIEF